MKIPEDTLTILSKLDVLGNEVRITETLDRATYTKINKVLEAIGGKWNRKAKAHVFGSEAQPRLDLVIVTGEVETGSDVGFFETPDVLADELVALADVRPGMTALEPSAGKGRIVLALQDAGAVVTAVEWDADRRKYLQDSILRGKDLLALTPDFMNFGVDEEGVIPFPQCAFLFNRIVMNPPFCKCGLGDHLDHVRHAFELLKPDGILVSVLPSSISFRQDRRYREFREWVAFHGAIAALPEGSFKSSGTGVNTCVVRLVK